MAQRCSVAVITAVAVSIASFPLLCHAAPNGYTQIPIAKVFGDGVAAFSFNSQLLGTYGAFYTTQYGIFNHTEVGVDYLGAPSSQRTYLGNAKYLLEHKPGKLPDIACGIVNVATGQRATPYVVATTQPGALGLSLGMIRPTAGGFVGMGGLAYNASPTVQVVTDYVSGHDSYSTLGVIAAVTKNISVNLAYARPNRGGTIDSPNPKGYVFNLAYVFHLKGGDKAGGSGGGGNKNPSAGGAGGGQ